MQLTCPTCGNSIEAANINVHDKIAVCSNCDTVFEFALPEEKAKRRKVKQPAGLKLNEGRNLTLAFRTNWRLDSNQEFILTAFGAGMAIFITNFMTLDVLTGGTPIALPIFFAALAVVMIYLMMLNVYNETRITMDEQSVFVTREPLPRLFNRDVSVSLSGVESIYCAETEISKERGYDTPRYIVWAQTVDGMRRPIITDLVEEYAYYVTQKLNEYLQPHDVSHLEDRAYDEDRLTNYDSDRYDHQSTEKTS